MKTPNTIALPRLAASVPHVDQYLGAWGILPDAMQQALSMVRAMDLEAHIAARQSRGAGMRSEFSDGYAPPYQKTTGGVAVIEVVGVMTKYGSSFSECRSSIELRRGVRQAAADSSVRAIALRIDSPGGQTKGIDDLAEAVRSAAEHKPVAAYIEDMGCSAAYYVASGATMIHANASALVGSIGTYAVIADYSKAAEMQGVTVHVVRSGAFKGAGEEGAPITDEHLADFQRIVDDINGLFLNAVGAGRGLAGEALAAVSDGRAWIASEAMSLGLVDAIGSFEDLVAQLEQGDAKTTPDHNGPSGASAAADHTKPRKEHDMSKTTTPSGRAAARSTAPETTPKKSAEEEDPTKAPEDGDPGDPGDEDPMKKPAASSRQPLRLAQEQPATIKELKAACPKADAEFREQCLEDGLTLAEAKDRYTQMLEEKIDAKAAAPAAPDKRSGVEPVGTRATSAASPSGAKAEFEALVSTYVQGGMKRHEAHKRVCQEQPELRERMVREHTRTFRP